MTMYMYMQVLCNYSHACPPPGRAQAGRDMAVFLSHSGATKECVVAAARLGERGVATMAITAGKGTYAQHCDH